MIYWYVDLVQVYLASLVCNLRLLVFIVLSVFSCASSAKIEVAFFSSYDFAGQLIQLEPGGRFTHVAIAYAGGWAHIHPQRGFEIVRSLAEIGLATEILSNEHVPDLSAEQMQRFFGLSYDASFSWHRTGSSYCSKFVGQLLNISPLPMTFSTPYWQQFRNLPVNQLGLSPDDIYQVLRSRSYHSTFVGQCRHIFAN